MSKTIKSVLHIYRYVSKKGIPYFSAYYGGQFYFVHLSAEAKKRCMIATNKNGDKYILYEGLFTIDENTIIVK